VSVISTTPAAGASAVARSSPISFTLNQAPLANTLPATQPDSVQLLTPEGVNLLTGVSVSGDTVSIANSGLALAGNTTYHVKLASSIGTASGKTLAAPFSWSFTTASANWATSGSNISPFHGFPPSEAIGTATDGAGNVFVAWIDQGTAGDTIDVQMFDASSNSWNATATTVFTSALGNLGSLNLSTDPLGEPSLTWVGYSGVYSFPSGNQLALFLSTFQLTGPGAGTWSTPVITPIDPGPYTPTGVTQVAANHTLTVAAHMYSTSGSVPAQGIFIDQYDEVAKSWGPITTINTTAAYISPSGTYLASAVDALGNITLAYVDGVNVSGPEHLYTTTKAAASTSWSAPQQIDTLTSGTIGSVVLAAGVGATTLSWMQTVGGAQPTIEVSRLGSDLATWSAPHQLDDGTSPSGAMNPSIAMDNAGFVDVSYTQSNTSNTVASTDGVFLVRFNPTSATWSSPMRMSAVGAAISSGPVATALDNAGNVQLLYQISGGVAPANYYVTTGSIVAPGIIDDPNGAPLGYNEPPYLVIGPDNVATGVWIDGETAGSFIRADRRQ
jgi:hypothetical protein